MNPNPAELACWDVRLTIGRYAGWFLNEKPLTLAAANELARADCQRGRPMVELNHGAMREAWNKAITEPLPEPLIVPIR